MKIYLFADVPMIDPKKFLLSYLKMKGMSIGDYMRLKKGQGNITEAADILNLGDVPQYVTDPDVGRIDITARRAPSSAMETRRNEEEMLEQPNPILHIGQNERMYRKTNENDKFMNRKGNLNSAIFKHELQHAKDEGLSQMMLRHGLRAGHAHQEVLNPDEKIGPSIQNREAILERRADANALKGTNLASQIDFVNHLSNSVGYNRFHPEQARQMEIASDTWEPQRIKSIVRNSWAGKPDIAKVNIAKKWIENGNISDQLRNNLQGLVDHYDKTGEWFGYFSEQRVR